MSLIIAVIVAGIVQLAGLALMVWFLTRALEQQNKTVQMLAMFKKAENVSDMAAMVDITDTDGANKPAAKVEVVEEHLLPDQFNNDQLLQVRAQM